MTPGRKSPRGRAAALLPAAAWYGVIWRFSAQTAAVSGELSDRLLYRLMALFSPAFAAAGELTRNAAVELLSFFARKTAHMFLYFVLALLIYFSVCCLSRRTQPRIGLTALACTLLAGLDEYHQTLVPGRSGELRDVLVDLCGAGIALGFLALPYLVRWSRRSLRIPLPALVPVMVCLLCLFLSLRSPQAHAASSLAHWSAVQFVPGAAAMSQEELTKFLWELAPALRDILFLAACGVTGVCIPMAGLLTELRLSALCGLCAGAAVTAAGLSRLGGAALPLACGGIVLLGILGMGALWWIAANLSPIRQTQQRQS